jgi:outer membrane protein TolC
MVYFFKIIISSAVFLLCVNCNLYAESLSIKKIPEIATSRSDLLRSEIVGIDEKKYATVQAGKYQNPSLHLQMGEKKAANESGPDYQATYSQPFYYPGKRSLRIQIAEQDTLIKEHELSFSETEIRLSSIASAYSYLIALEKSNHVKERVKRFKIIEAYLNSRPFQTPQAKSDLYIVQSRLANLQKHLIHLESDRYSMWEKLNFFLGKENEITITPEWFKSGVHLSLEDSLRISMSLSPKLQNLRVEIQKAELQTKLASMEKFSDFNVDGTVGEDRSGIRQRFFDFGVSFKLPVMDSYSNQVKSLESRKKSLEALLTHETKSMESNVRFSYREFLASKRILENFPIKMAHEIDKKLAYSDTEFIKGRITLINYLDLENQLHETHHVIFDSQLEYVQKYVQLLLWMNNSEFVWESENVK